MKKQKKAQMEIMGIAIIVILLTFAMLFVFKYVILKKPADIRSDFSQVELASNTINTLLATTSAECNKLSFEQLFLECAEDTTLQCRGMGPCQYAESEAEKIFQDTLDAWKIRYNFYVVRAGDDKIITNESSLPCSEDADIKSKQFPLPGAVPVNVIIEICSK